MDVEKRKVEQKRLQKLQDIRFFVVSLVIAVPLTVMVIAWISI